MKDDFSVLLTFMAAFIFWGESILDNFFGRSTLNCGNLNNLKCNSQNEDASFHFPQKIRCHRQTVSIFRNLLLADSTPCYKLVSDLFGRLDITILNLGLIISEFWLICIHFLKTNCNLEEQLNGVENWFTSHWYGWNQQEPVTHPYGSTNSHWKVLGIVTLKL